jgi:hypothetical protein
MDGIFFDDKTSNFFNYCPFQLSVPLKPREYTRDEWLLTLLDAGSL